MFSLNLCIEHQEQGLVFLYFDSSFSFVLDEMLSGGPHCLRFQCCRKFCKPCMKLLELFRFCMPVVRLLVPKSASS